MAIFRFKSKSLLLIGLVGISIAFAFNNCSQVNFAETKEAVLFRLNSGGTVLINMDDKYTNSKNVSLYIEHNSAKEMYITNDPTCQAGGVWEPYSKSKAWVLAQENAEAKVFAKFKEKSSADDPESDCSADDIIHDNIPPVISVVKAAPTLTNASNIEVTFTAVDALSGVASLECLDNNNKSLSSCTESLSLSNVPEGPGSVAVRATDRAGNQSLPMTQTWVVDRTPPVVKINSAPSMLTNIVLSVFEFSGTDNYSTSLAYECRVDALTYASCSSPFSATLSSGDHQFYVRAKDQAGNISAEVTYKWKIDLTAPTVEITAKPNPASNLDIGNFSFIGNDEGLPLAKYECQVDGAAFVLCTSPFATTKLNEGPHNFSVRGYDTVGNVSAPASYSWIVDLSPPTVIITSKPPIITKDAVAIFAFTAVDAQTGIAVVECSLDGATFSACQNTITYNNLIQGVHKFQVRAQDLAGNISAPVSYSWTVDQTPPTIQIISGPSPLTNQTTAQIVLLVTDNFPGTNMIQCRLDNQAFAVCTENVLYSAISEGPHTFYAHATDSAGNTSADVTYTWIADVTGPAINFTKVPLQHIKTTDMAVVEFIVTDSGSGVDTVTCGLSGAPQVNCPVTKLEQITGLAVGTYIYSVTAKDRVGNTTTNSITWTVDNNTQTVIQNINVTSNNKVDVLVVIDNSGSMAPEQSNMAQRFSSFIDTLNGLDWQIAIVTTDVDKDTAKRDGRFLEFTGLPGKFIITSAMDGTVSRNAFASTIQRPASEGSGNEQGIAASYRAIERSQDATKPENAPNVSFFRSGSALAILVVSDSNETNPLGTQLRNIPQNLISLVAKTWMSKSFVFHSIVIKSGDSVCLNVPGNELYGTSYEQLSSLTGGIIGSVCEPNYTTQLTNIGNSVTDLIKSVTLQCSPLDTNNDGKADLSIQLANGAAAPTYILDMLKLTFASALPVGQNTLTYTCLK